MARRLHCATCTCADVWDRGRIDTAAPFYGLVIEIDRITYAEIARRGAATAAERRTTEAVAS